jgi:hypothetical protein
MADTPEIIKMARIGYVRIIDCVLRQSTLNDSMRPFFSHELQLYSGGAGVMAFAANID